MSTLPDWQLLLTAREREVVHLVIQGLCNKEIARQLGITESSTKQHLAHVFKKLKIHTRTRLVVYALSSGTQI